MHPSSRSCLHVTSQATASVDSKTDLLIQQAVSTCFGGAGAGSGDGGRGGNTTSSSAVGRQGSRATLLIIAHRLHTIIDADRVLVLGDGRVLECDTPSALLQAGGAFAKLVAEVGVEEAALLRDKAIATHSAAGV